MKDENGISNPNSWLQCLEVVFVSTWWRSKKKQEATSEKEVRISTVQPSDHMWPPVPFLWPYRAPHKLHHKHFFFLLPFFNIWQTGGTSQTSNNPQIKTGNKHVSMSKIKVLEHFLAFSAQVQHSHKQCKQKLEFHFPTLVYNMYIQFANTELAMKMCLDPYHQIVTGLLTVLRKIHFGFFNHKKNHQCPLFWASKDQAIYIQIWILKRKKITHP